MTDEVDRFSEMLEGYADRSRELVAAWAPFLNDLSTRLEAGPYGPDEATADFPAVARLTVESIVALGAEAFDAASIMTVSFDEKETVGGLMLAKASTTRTLTVKDDLKSVSGETLPKNHVTIDPDHLAPQETTFALSADGTGVKARTYDGWVVATDPNGVSSEVPVTVTIG
jgi:hypothetical protein